MDEVRETEGKEGGQQETEAPLKTPVRKMISASALILTYILWAFILIMIKNQSMHNCGWAFPAASFPYLIIIFLLTFIVFFSTRMKRKHARLIFALLMVYTSLLLTFFLYISVMGMCQCSDPETVAKTYIAVSMVFMGDIAIKGAMFNGLM